MCMQLNLAYIDAQIKFLTDGLAASTADYNIVVVSVSTIHRTSKLVVISGNSSARDTPLINLECALFLP